MTVKEDMSIQVNKQAQTHHLSRYSDWATFLISKKSWFDSRTGKCYLFSTASKPVMGATEISAYCVLWAVTLGVNRMDRLAD